MKKIIFCLLILLANSHARGQCKYIWAQFQNQGATDTAVGLLFVNGTTINMTMTANYNFDFTPTIFNYTAFAPYPDVPPNATVIRTTWSFGAGGVTTMCFSQPVVNPVLLLASIGSLAYPVSLNLSLPFNVLYDGGGNTFLGNQGIYGAEGNCIIEFPGTFTCISIFSTTLEFYTNLTWGIKNPLTAAFTFNTACASQSVSFSSAGSYVNPPGSIIAYHWDFGDGDTSNLVNPVHAFATPDTFNVSLVITSDNFCTDTLIQPVMILNSGLYNNPQTICTGSSYSIGSNVYTTAGTYHDTIQTPNGCDSIIVTQLSVNSSVVNNNVLTICSGQSVSVNSHVYTTSGIYHDSLTTASGCDSIIVTDLTVDSAYSLLNNQSLCNGVGYTINSHTYTTSGTYFDTLTTSSGCDSIVVTQLSLSAGQTFNNPQSICSGQAYQLNAHSYLLPGTYYDTLTSASGCDSVLITSLSVSPPPIVTFAHPNDVCIDAPPLILNYAAPVGGVYSGTGISNGTFVPSMAQAGTHQLNYSYTDPVTNCSNSKNETITVHPLPDVLFSITPKNVNVVAPLINYADLTPNAAAWSWDFGDNSTSQVNAGTHQYSDMGHYIITLIVTDTYGCSNFSEIPVLVDYEFSFYVPNSFTPDGNGVNDLFSGLGVGFETYNMQIYNRWGKVIFETDKPYDRWDAKDVPGDTYVYKINLTDNIGQEHEYVGKVSVVR